MSKITLSEEALHGLEVVCKRVTSARKDVIVAIKNAYSENKSGYNNPCECLMDMEIYVKQKFISKGLEFANEKMRSYFIAACAAIVFDVDPKVLKTMGWKKLLEVKSNFDADTDLNISREERYKRAYQRTVRRQNTILTEEEYKRMLRNMVTSESFEAICNPAFKAIAALVIAMTRPQEAEEQEKVA